MHVLRAPHPGHSYLQRRLRTSRSVPRMEWPAAASAGVTYAPTLSTAEQVPPGEPTDVSAGPALPALDTKMTPCFSTTCGYAMPHMVAPTQRNL